MVRDQQINRVKRGYSNDPRLSIQKEENKPCNVSKLVIIMSLIAIFISAIMALTIRVVAVTKTNNLSNQAFSSASTYNQRIFAVKNAGEIHERGEYYGWNYNRNYPEIYNYGRGFERTYMFVLYVVL